MPAGRLRTWGFTLAVIGYLCVPGLLVTDQVLWLGADRGMSAEGVAAMVDGAHPSVLVQEGLFVPAHVIGIVLIGVLALRRRLVPVPVAWALILSQPLHFLTAVALGLAWVDLGAWSTTALGMGWLAAVMVPGGHAASARSGDRGPIGRAHVPHPDVRG